METKLTVLIPKELQEQAKAVASSRGETLSDVVRSALLEYVEDITEETTRSEYDGETALKSDPLFSLRFTGGPGDVSERVEEILMEAADPTTGLNLGDDRAR